MAGVCLVQGAPEELADVELGARREQLVVAEHVQDAVEARHQVALAVRVGEFEEVLWIKRW
jgi:hypothetical protein